MYNELDWHNLYSESWKGVIEDKAFSHPAKFSRKLIAKIYQHCFECGYLKQGDKVLDPFGGVALGALEALRRGCEWYGVELEQKFVNLGNENLALWNRKYGKSFAKWSKAYLMQGDSRYLIKVLSEPSWHLAGGTYIANPFTVGITSPSFTTNNPKQGGAQGIGTYIDQSKSNSEDPNFAIGRVKDDYSKYESSANLATLPTGTIDIEIASPAYANIATGAGGLNTLPPRDDHDQGGRNPDANSQDTNKKYGDAEGQMSGLIASPPFGAHDNRGSEDQTTLGISADGKQRGGKLNRESYGDAEGQLGNLDEMTLDLELGSPAYGDARIGQTSGAANVGTGENYGESEGQLGKYDATINSPPYEDSIKTNNQNDEARKRKAERLARGEFTMQRPDVFTSEKNVSAQAMFEGNYGFEEGQLGREQGETFWSAARLIVQQVYRLLKPKGIAVWVVKDYVKNKQRVPFADQWRQLCEACGFTTLTKVRAWVTEYDGKQLMYDGNNKELKKSHISFFRREVDTKAAWRNHWDSLDDATQQNYLNAAPDRKQRLLHTQRAAFTFSNQRVEDWNQDIRIDYEVVWFMQKV